MARLGQLDRAARRDPLEMWGLPATRVIRVIRALQAIRAALDLRAIRVFLERR